MLLKCIYKLKNPHVKEEDIPYWWKRTVFQQIWHSIRKWICQVWAPNCILNFVRISLYRLCGLKIGKGVFIGMKCYLDDLCIDKIVIEDNCTISYGVYFSCHGPHQNHNIIHVKKGAYIGMRTNIIASSDLCIGENSIIGAGTLVNRSVPKGATCVGVPGKVIK